MNLVTFPTSCLKPSRMVADFICYVFPSSSVNNGPIWKISKLTCSLLYFLTLCVVKKILQPNLSSLVRCFGPVLYFFLLFIMTSSCHVIKQIRTGGLCNMNFILPRKNSYCPRLRLGQYEFFLGHIKFILHSPTVRICVILHLVQYESSRCNINWYCPRYHAIII